MVSWDFVSACVRGIFVVGVDFFFLVVYINEWDEAVVELAACTIAATTPPLLLPRPPTPSGSFISKVYHRVCVSKIVLYFFYLEDSERMDPPPPQNVRLLSVGVVGGRRKVGEDARAWCMSVCVHACMRALARVWRRRAGGGGEAVFELGGLVT